MNSARVDVHAHFVPRVYREALAAAGVSRPDGMPSVPDWSEEAALAAMDTLGIRTAVLSVSSPGVHFGDDAAARALARRVNEEGARLCQAHPARFGLFASVPLPDLAGALAEAVYALDTLGAAGVIVETNHHGLYLGDERLDPLYAALHERRAVLFIHPTSPSCAGCDALALGYPRPMIEFMFETTRSVAHMILSGVTARHPEMRVIVPHAGAALPVLAGRLELFGEMLAPASTAMPDVRAALRSLYYDLAGAPVPELLNALLAIADPQRLLYGSDWPWTPLAACVKLAGALDATPSLGPALRDAVMSGNAARLFGERAALTATEPAGA
jgi:6-methylsalicylate decarboxylase